RKHGLLVRHQRLDSFFRQRHHLRQLRIVEWTVLRRRLHFDNLLAAGNDQVHVHVGARVFFVTEIEHDLAVHDADAGGGHVVANRNGLEHAGFDHGGHGQTHGDKSSGDGCGAGASISLDDIAVDEDGALAELVHVGDGAQGAANEALNFVGASAGASLGHFARTAGQCGARQHAVLGGDPAFAAVTQKLRNGVLYGGGADDTRIAQFDQARAFSGGDIAGDDVQRPDLVGSAIVGAIDHKPRLYRSGRSAIRSAAEVNVLHVVNLTTQETGGQPF